MAVLDQLGAPTLNKKDMPYVVFETRTEEDVRASKEQGRMVWKDQHYARITQPGSKDVHYEKIPAWWAKIELESRSGRILPELVELWKSNYERFKKGLEIPVDGTPIRGWSMISGAQQENLIAVNLLTVESLASATSEAMARIGMGALELKRRAEAWLAQRNEIEPAAVKMSQLQRENDVLKETVANLMEKVDTLSKAVEPKGQGRK